jgi:SNF2 family DNA or RNA helicase
MASPLHPVWPGAAYARHQEEGIRWMLDQEKVGVAVGAATIRGGILGDEMGLGKTIQTLALCANNKVRRTLILTPLAVRQQWVDAATRGGAAGSFNVYTAEKGVWKAHTKILLRRPDLYIGHYDKLNSETHLFSGILYNRIICDEAHRTRNPRTSTAKNLLSLAADYKWCLTGTPIVNGLEDCVVYLRFLGFPCHEKSRTFQPQYREWIRSCYLARTMDECEPPAGMCVPPEPHMEVRSLDFTNEEEAEIYDTIYKNLEQKYREAQKLQGRAYTLAFLSILLRLRQVSITPQIYIDARRKDPLGWSGPSFNLPSRKFDEMALLMREAFDGGNKRRWIVFCQFKSEIDHLTSFFRALPFIGNIGSYHGGLSHKERDAEIAASKVFSAGNLQDVFLVQLHAGGTGLNLQHYDSVIFSSPWWTAALMDQAIGRAVRIGQAKKVRVYMLRLSAEDTFNIDSFILLKAEKKRQLSEVFQSWSVGRMPLDEGGAEAGEDDDSIDIDLDAEEEPMSPQSRVGGAPGGAATPRRPPPVYMLAAQAAAGPAGGAGGEESDEEDDPK